MLEDRERAGSVGGKTKKQRQRKKDFKKKTYEDASVDLIAKAART
jgi:hypothetical protein